MPVIIEITLLDFEHASKSQFKLCDWLLNRFTLACTSLFGVILVGLLIGITICIKYLKGNELQDWLGRCRWGVKKKEDRYKTIEEEIKQFDLAKA
ncbi:hypothetical protein [Iodobacter fluviatilis]|nr:hypothetical protein [Iodobacter fluviatilis]